METCFIKAMSLKTNRMLSPAKSSCFAAVLYLFCTDCSSVVGERRTAVRGHQLSAQALEAAVWDCNATLQSCWAFEKPQLGLVEWAKCSRVGLSPFCCSCHICEQIVFFANVSVRAGGLDRKWILCVLVRWEKTGLVLAPFLCTPECGTREVCMLHGLLKQCKTPLSFKLCGLVKYIGEREGRTAAAQPGELMQSRKFLLDRSVEVFYLSDLTFIRKSQEECESFPFFFLKAHAVVLWRWIAGFVGGGGAELPFWGDPALVFSSSPRLTTTER